MLEKQRVRQHGNSPLGINVMMMMTCPLKRGYVCVLVCMCLCSDAPALVFCLFVFAGGGESMDKLG